MCHSIYARCISKTSRCTAALSFNDGVFAKLVERIENGTVKPLIAAVLSLDEIVDAQKLFLTKRHVGKIVLTI